MSLKIYKYPLKMKAAQVITLPASSWVLSIKNQHEVPVLYAVVDTDCEIEGYLTVECFGTGQLLHGEVVTEITETLLFQNGNLVLHFFVQEFPEKFPRIPNLKSMGNTQESIDKMANALQKEVITN
ncbi:hypothetical protein BU180_02465 [Listeria monocytogenes]|nr:hypothetical protein [Listeria monocytogenes]